MDGKLVPFNKAQVHIMSHSFARGSAIFEVMSLHETKNGPAVFRLDEHIKRLFVSAENARMVLPFSSRKFRQVIKEAIKANKVNSGMVKLFCYYGGVEFEVIPRVPVVSVAVMAVDVMKDLKSDRFNKQERPPASVKISDRKKPDPMSIPVECKSTGTYLNGMIAKMEAQEEGFSTPILLDQKGNLAEGPTESIFLIKNRTLKTPALGPILSGITRKTVLELARDIGIKIVEKKIKPVELIEADEAFLTSSIMKIWPISKVEDKQIYCPGEITRLLDKSLEKILSGKVKSYKNWLSVIK
jgi:branched-chain amino acid aminotransferase